MKKFNNNNIDTLSKKDISWRLIVAVICLLIIVLASYSCDDFVEVELPNSQLTTQGVF